MGVALLIVSSVLMLTVIRSIWGQANRLDERDARWLQGIAPSGEEVLKILTDYLHRVRLFRLGGAVIGGVGALALALVFSEDPTVLVGAEDPWLDVIFASLTGVLAGSLFADTVEMFRERRRGFVDESYAPSGQGSGATQWLQTASWAFVSLTVIGAFISGSGVAQELAIISIVFSILSWVTVRHLRSSHRALQALDIRHAQESVRQYGDERLSTEALAAAVLFFGWQLAMTGLGDSSWRGPLLFAVAAVAWLLVTVERPYPPWRS